MATPRKCLPPSKSSELRLHVAGMDCADEAALMRHALARPGVEGLNFDLVGRRVDVQFNPEKISAEAIIGAVQATGLAAHTHRSGVQVGYVHHGPDHGHCSASAWAIASGAAFLVAWVIEGASADSWAEALLGFGAHGAGDGVHGAHHLYAVVAYGVATFAGLW